MEGENIIKNTTPSFVYYHLDKATKYCDLFKHPITMRTLDGAVK